MPSSESSPVAQLSAEKELSVQQVAEGVPKFVEKDCRSFRSEWALVGEDIHFHFYLPQHAHPNLATPEGRQAWMNYWLRTFPPKLEQVALEYFGVGYPRLVAKYTEEVGSWWLRARGFSDVLDQALFAAKFLERLDQALQAGSESQ